MSTLIVGVTLAFFSPAAGVAQTVHDTEARAAFHSGERAFAIGDFGVALEHFQRAYELSERPALLYNIGQCHDRLRHDREAVVAFESYLTQRPEATNRETVRARIAILRRQLADDEASRAREQELSSAAARREEEASAARVERDRAQLTAQDARVAAEAERRERERLAALQPDRGERGSIVTRWWFWTLVGVVVVGGTLGVVAATRDAGTQAPIPGDTGGSVTALVWR